MKRAPERVEQEQKLLVQTKAVELFHHTLSITSNENVFDPKYQWLINVVLSDAINIHRYLSEANELNLYNCYEDRKKLEENAIKLCKTLKADIRVCHKVFKLRTKKTINWTRMVDELIVLIRAWKESDRTRYRLKNKK